MNYTAIIITALICASVIILVKIATDADKGGGKK